MSVVVSRRMAGRICECVCVARMLLRQAGLGGGLDNSRQDTRQSNHNEAGCSSRERESDVILKVMRAGAGIPERWMTEAGLWGSTCNQQTQGRHLTGLDAGSLSSSATYA